ncbi:DUF3429 domain-containing protein [Francisella marina]|uniref:DUF3429 domain-containing protein n=1 Tax=Francisella marina TaxID=2249302 RepID=A0ABX5ZGW9_9GAMM|nr:DUF3429 domain-containing protein [Francisella marina]QEO57696.1 DUF3429 domain-containing protein [Francisella marina]QEO60078.1 DUF3429 domain-containing protein [Francisella marina]
MKSYKSLDIYLAYLGLVPFIFFSSCILLGHNSFLIFENIAKALSVYGLVITCFMAGTHWGRQINLEPSFTKTLIQVASNLIAIIIWLGYLNLDPQDFILLLIAEFLILLKVDYYFFKLNLISSKYFKCIRLPITLCVVISLAVSWSLV